MSEILAHVLTTTPSGTLSQSGASVGAFFTVVVMVTLIASHRKTSVELCVWSSAATMTSPLLLRPRGLSRGRTIIMDVRQTTPLETSTVSLFLILEKNPQMQSVV